MIRVDDPIIPYEGVGQIKLYSNPSDVIDYLEKTDTPYIMEKWSLENEGVKEDPDPWTIIDIKNIMRLFFASNNKLFKIALCQDYKGALPNGISLSSPFQEAMSIDSTLKFDDWDEIFISENGYFMETDVDNEAILNISIFIREMETSEFDNLEWQKNCK